MKIFVAVLALVLIASSQGSLLFRGEPQSKWEEAIEDFWTFATQVSQATEAAVIGIKSSELDQQFQGLISDSITELNASLDILRAKLGPYADKLNTDLSHLRERLQRDMGSVKTMLLLYNEEAQLIANQKAGELRQSLNLYLRKYRKRLNRDSEEIRKKFQAYSQDLRAKSNRTLEDLREMLEPHTRAVGEKLQERLDNIQQVLTRQAEEVRSKAEVLQGQVSENAEQLRILLRQRMEEIRDWFEAGAKRVTQQFTDLFDSLREQDLGTN